MSQASNHIRRATSTHRKPQRVTDTQAVSKPEKADVAAWIAFMETAGYTRKSFRFSDLTCRWIGVVSKTTTTPNKGTGQ